MGAETGGEKGRERGRGGRDEEERRTKEAKGADGVRKKGQNG